MILTRVKNEIGATAIEYGLLASLIGVATITGLQLTGVKLDNTYCYIATQISKAVGGSGGRCSATPSNSSGSSPSSGANSSSAGSPSGSSADGSGSSTDSSGSSAGSPSGSSGTSSCGSGVQCNASNSYSVIPRSMTYPLLLQDLMQIGRQKITNQQYIMPDSVSISGIYDDSGHELTSDSDIASYLGVTSEYNALRTAQETQYASPSLANNKIAGDDMAALQSALNNKTLYVPNLSQVSFSGTLPNGTTFKTTNSISRDLPHTGTLPDINGTYTVTNSNGETSSLTLGMDKPTN